MAPLEDALSGITTTWLLAALGGLLFFTFLAGTRAGRVKAADKVDGKINGESKPNALASPMRPQELAELIRKRRSIFPKDFTGDTVPREKVEQLLEAANWAPTHGRTEPWRWVVLGREEQDRMVDLTLKVADRELSPEKAAAKRKKLTSKRPDYAKVSHMIMICMKREAIPGKLNPEWEEECAVACAVQNIYLMTTALGLGGYWCSWTPEVRASPEFKVLLGLGPEDKCLGLFMLGQPSDRADGYRAARGPLSEKVTWKL